MPQGQIRKALSGFYYVYRDGETFQTRGRGNFRKRSITPMVGDQVIFSSENQAEGYILEILPRKNELVRPPVANVDQGIVVMSCVEPDFSFYLLDRLLVMLEYERIHPLIYFTKTDLLDELDFAKFVAIAQAYERIGYPTFLPEPDHKQSAVQALTSHFSQQVTVFMGQSGAGKSTLLNTISPELELLTGEISTALGRGRHTTRHVELIPLNDGLVADTPGFSSLDFTEITEIELPRLFPEFERAAKDCKFRACMHRHEPGCAVKQQVADQIILQSRYDNYLQFLAELENRKPLYNRKKK